MPELVLKSSIVVRGRISKSPVRVVTGLLKVAQGFEFAFTDHELTVENFLKVQPALQQSNTIVVRTMGGEAPNLSMYVDSEARFSINENVIVFLSQDHERAPFSFVDSPSAFTVVGGFQGKYTITSRSGALFAKRHDERDEALRKLDDFEKEIRDNLDQNDNQRFRHA